MIPHTVLIVHNHYRQPGGEDAVFEAESALLEQAGHRVIRYEEHNTRIGSGLITAAAVTWNQNSYTALQKAIRTHKPGVIHFHNTFPLISPAAYYAALRHDVPVVQKLSNFRLICPGGFLLRDGKPCEECVEERSFRPAIAHKCYRDSRPATAAVAGMLLTHRFARTWNRMVDVYIAHTEFARGKFIDAGLPADRIVVKPQMVSPDPGAGDGSGRYALFVGRLSEEKGIATLAAAWRTLAGLELRIAGDGPLATTEWPSGVTWLGSQTRDQVKVLMQNASVVIVPSLWYEIGPLTVIEAFACGTPVIASNLGSMAERIDDRRTGLLFNAGDAQDLAGKVRWAFDHPEQLSAMRIRARSEYEEKYTAECSYKMLMEIYEQAMLTARRGRLVAS